MAPSKYTGLAIGEVSKFWARDVPATAQIGAFWAAFGAVIKLDFEFALGEKSSKEVVRILLAWGVSLSTAQFFVSERMTNA